MKKIVRLTESDLIRLVKRVINEQETTNNLNVGDTVIVTGPDRDFVYYGKIKEIKKLQTGLQDPSAKGTNSTGLTELKINMTRINREGLTNSRVFPALLGKSCYYIKIPNNTPVINKKDYKHIELDYFNNRNIMTDSNRYNQNINLILLTECK